MEKPQKKLFILAPYTPVVEDSWTYYRSELIAIEAIKSNFEVNIICTNFDYRSKKIFTKKKDISSSKKFIKIRLDCGTFQKSIGLERIIFELKFGIRASQYLTDNLTDESSLILIDPCLVWFYFIRKLINERNSFLIVDILDLWPEALLTSFKSIFLKNLIKIIFPIIKNLRYKIWMNADLITSCTKEYSELVKSKINRNANTFYIGSSLKPILNKIYKNKDISNLEIILDNKIGVIYSGSYTNNYPINYICEAINIFLNQNFLEIVFIFCGDGNQKFLIENLSKKFPKNVFNLGRLNKTDLNDIYNLSSIALNIYNRDSPVKMPLKLFDYSLFDLFIINTIEGEASEWIKNEGRGSNFLNNNLENPSQLTEEIKKAITLIKKSKGGLKRKIINTNNSFLADINHAKYMQLINSYVSQDVKIIRWKNNNFFFKNLSETHKKCFKSRLLASFSIDFTRLILESLKKISILDFAAIGKNNECLGYIIFSKNKISKFDYLKIIMSAAIRTPFLLNTLIKNRYNFLNLIKKFIKESLKKNQYKVKPTKFISNNEDSIVVLRSICSKRKGIGGMLIRISLKELKARGYKSVILETDNEPSNEAILFYKKYGFTEINKLSANPERLIMQLNL